MIFGTVTVYILKQGRLQSPRWEDSVCFMAVQNIEAAQERVGEIHSNPEIAAVRQLLTKERPPPSRRFYS